MPAPDPEKAKAEHEAMVKRTVDWQHARAEAGSPTSQYDLGMRYLRGEGVEKDLESATKWLERAAANGSVPAGWELAKLRPEKENRADGAIAAKAPEVESAPKAQAAGGKND